MTKTIFVYKIVFVALVAIGFLFPLALAHADQCIAGTLYKDDGKTPILDSDGNKTPCEAEFQSEGLFGCNKSGAEAMSVGSISVLDSTYVPVSDNAVTLNTGYITYKECIADGIFRNVAESATAQRAASGLMTLLTGRNGEPLFPVDLAADMLALTDETRLRTLQSGELTTINSAFQGDIMRALARNYRARTRASNQALACPYQGDLNAVLKGKSNDIWGGLTALMNPACNPLGAYQLAEEYAEKQEAAQVNEQLFRLQTSGGLYDVREYNPLTGRYETRTPGSLVAADAQQLITSGFRQLENATEIDQIVGALFSGLSTQVITDSRGLAGVIESSAGQPSYLDQMLLESTDKLQDAVKKSAKALINHLISVNADYLQINSDIADILTKTTEELQKAEDVCWNQILDKVCSPNPGRNAATCSATGGGQLTINTSEHPQDVIKDMITPIALTIAQNIKIGENADTLLQEIKKGISNNASREENRKVLIQLDSLVAQNVIPSLTDLKDAKKYKDTVKDAMEELITNTADEWTTGSGWCNPANATTWADTWKK